MIRYRSFRNTDPPKLVEIWRSANPQALAQSMSVSLLEDLVLGKPYFDRCGLIVACEGEKPVGFGHAGFGPSADRSALSFDTGVICMVAVDPSQRRQGIGRELAQRLEDYLRQRGARVIYAGGVRPFDPFYSGLYGGSQLPGVLESDDAAKRLFESLGYPVVDHLRRMCCDLSTFRPIVDRRQLQVRRSSRITSVLDPSPANWWEACTFGEFHRVRFELRPRSGESLHASATFWSADPIRWRPGERAIGLLDVQVDPEHRQTGLATFLLGEAFRELHENGYSLVDAQVLQQDELYDRILKKLGFYEIECGNVYRKEIREGEPDAADGKA